MDDASIMDEQETFDLEADPFNTGFEVADEITTDMVVKWMSDRDSFLPKGKQWNDPLWWKANAKAVIMNGWFTAPDWKPNEVNKWSLGKTRWLANWAIAKYEDMKNIPFGQ